MEVLYLLLAWFAMDAVLDNESSTARKQQEPHQVIESNHQETGNTIIKSFKGASQSTQEEALFTKGTFYKNQYGYYLTNLVSENRLDNLKKSDVVKPNIIIGVLK